MKVFLSWSGERSKHIAQSFSTWLEQVLQAVEPWISTDISKGSRWDDTISDKLSKSEVGIICLTQENLEAPWIHFEAGAISKNPKAYTCTFLYDITPATVKEPLAKFQHTLNNEADIFKLVKTINSLLEKPIRDESLKDIFATFWPKLEEKLKATPTNNVHQAIQRNDRDLLEETLEIVRYLRDYSVSDSAFKFSKPYDTMLSEVKGLVGQFPTDDKAIKITVSKPGVLLDSSKVISIIEPKMQSQLFPVTFLKQERQRGATVSIIVSMHNSTPLEVVLNALAEEGFKTELVEHILVRF